MRASRGVDCRGGRPAPGVAQAAHRFWGRPCGVARATEVAASRRLRHGGQCTTHALQDTEAPSDGIESWAEVDEVLLEPLKVPPSSSPAILDRVTALIDKAEDEDRLQADSSISNQDFGKAEQLQLEQIRLKIRAAVEAGPPPKLLERWAAQEGDASKLRAPPTPSAAPEDRLGSAVNVAVAAPTPEVAETVDVPEWARSDHRSRSMPEAPATGTSGSQQAPSPPTSIRSRGGWGEPSIPPPVAGHEPDGCTPEGSSYEILLQAFNWESHRGGWYQHCENEAERWAALGLTAAWLPPPTESVSPHGYMPLDLYNLNSRYGSFDELRRCVAKLQACGLKVLGDIVINHRCASGQDANGVWNRFGGRLDWDATAIVRDDRNFKGRGGRSSGARFDAAPNLDHSQPFVKRGLCEWLHWLRETAGYDGWRMDFVKGYGGEHVGDYMEATDPVFAVGEFWDSLAYSGSVPLYDQDAHRQRTIDWINASRGRATAFDVTTKGIMHAVFERCEFDRLRDRQGRPPGLMGAWPSRAVTFLENHDTGSTQVVHLGRRFSKRATDG